MFGRYTVGRRVWIAETISPLASVVLASMVISSFDSYFLIIAIAVSSTVFVVQIVLPIYGPIKAVRKYGILTRVQIYLKASRARGETLKEALNALAPQIIEEMGSEKRLRNESDAQRAGLSILASLGLSAGIWFRSILIRLSATAIYLFDGFQQLPDNFFQSLFVVDLRHRVELVPGCDHSLFTSEGLLVHARKSPDVSQALFYYTSFLVFVVPGYLYRISIKSTFWVFLPLVYVARRNNLLAGIESRKEWARRFLAIFTLIGFAFATLVLQQRESWIDILGVRVVSPIEYLFLVDLNSIRPWHVLQALSAAITIYLYFEADTIKERHANESWLTFLMRVRNLSAILLVILLVVHALLAFSLLGTRLPNLILTLLKSVYGPYFPVTY